MTSQSSLQLYPPLKQVWNALIGCMLGDPESAGRDRLGLQNGQKRIFRAQFPTSLSLLVTSVNMPHPVLILHHRYDESSSHSFSQNQQKRWSLRIGEVCGPTTDTDLGEEISVPPGNVPKLGNSVAVWPNHSSQLQCLDHFLCFSAHIRAVKVWLVWWYLWPRFPFCRLWFIFLSHGHCHSSTPRRWCSYSLLTLWLTVQWGFMWTFSCPPSLLTTGLWMWGLLCLLWVMADLCLPHVPRAPVPWLARLKAWVSPCLVPLRLVISCCCIHFPSSSSHRKCRLFGARPPSVLCGSGSWRGCHIPFKYSTIWCIFIFGRSFSGQAVAMHYGLWPHLDTGFT